MTLPLRGNSDSGLPWTVRDYDAWTYRHDIAEGQHDHDPDAVERLWEHGSHPAIKSPPKDTP